MFVYAVDTLVCMVGISVCSAGTKQINELSFLEFTVMTCWLSAVTV